MACSCRCASRLSASLPARPFGRTVQRHHGRLPTAFSTQRPEQDAIDDLLQADVERYKIKQPAPVQKPQPQQAQGSIWQGVSDAVDKVLVADFFLILFVGLWLLLGAVENNTLHSSVLLDRWYPLWPVLFQPAIGLLMLGALCSGLVSWLKSL